MDRSDALLSIAEIALGLAGFGGIFVALSRSHEGPRDPADAYRLVLLLGTALTTLLLSLLAVALQSVDLSEERVWAVSSALLTVSLASLMLVALQRRRRHPQEIRAGEARLVAAGIAALALVTLVAQILNAAGVFGDRGYAVFLFGLVFLTGFGGYLFARMLFLWRS